MPRPLPPLPHPHKYRELYYLGLGYAEVSHQQECRTGPEAEHTLLTYFSHGATVNKWNSGTTVYKSFDMKKEQNK
jgi:hypothetical protein